jgi:hypothetical protein
MVAWREALRTYRRRSLESGPRAGRPLMFVLCSEDHAAAAFLAACEPAIVLQTFGGAGAAVDSATRATFEAAVRLRGVRHVVVCGHSGCRAVTVDAGVDPRMAAQAETVAQCRRLWRDPAVGAVLRDHGVTMRAIWFDEDEGDIFSCDMEGRSPTLVSDGDFVELMGAYRSLAQ